MKRNDEIEKIGLIILGGIIVSSGIAFGFSTEMGDFFRYFVLAAIAYIGGVLWLTKRKSVDERVATLEGILEDVDGYIVNMEDKISGYEEILDGVSIKIPCHCGDNTFDGIFQPEEETIVVCEKCKSKYAVTLKLDSVLISEPIEDLNIDKLITDNIKKPK